ncbi:MAG TPA: YihY/virulence factor BrkB family protein [Methanothrix sp.]|nr:YihY/virulence factor BrkB family protein [Methanothrix sp.]HRW82322.1 YihY/virulence factor BrkB family protein [Methanothrix sp.]
MKKIDPTDGGWLCRTRDRAESLFVRADGFSRGALSLSIEALRSFNAARGSEAAAAIAYYALFSLFPLLIILVVLASPLLQSQEVQIQILKLVREVLPPGEELAKESLQRILELGRLPSAQDMLKENVAQMMMLRVPVGIVAAAGLLWSSTSVFTALALNVDRAWRGATRRNYLRWRLLGLAMAGGLMTVLLVVSLFLAGLFGLLSGVSGGSTPLYQAWFLGTLSNLVPVILVFSISFALYLWAPNTDVKLDEAALGALVATSAWTVSKMAFSWYLAIWLARHRLVYGSLGTVVALMLWVYLSGMIILYGAHLSAAIAQRRRRRPAGG